MQNMKGFRAFSVIWFGQSVSLIGTAMTRFALTIWAYQTTGSATALALVAFFSFGPMVLFSPIAGALVDRWNRKTIMIMADLAAGLATMSLLFLYATGQLQIWHLYVAGAFASTFEAFQFPAFSAAITMMIDKKHYARANGMQSLSDSGSTIVAPVIATIMLVATGIAGVMIIDIITFFIAIGTIILIDIPQPKLSTDGQKAQGSLLQESLFGFRYILARPPLLGIQCIFFLTNLFSAFGLTLLPVMILARTGNDEVSLGTVQSMLGIGGFVGGLLMSTWGGPKRRVNGVLFGMFLSGVFGQVTLGLGQNVLVWSVGAFLLMFFVPFINGSNQAIWQSKVPADLQGRVFSVRRLIAQITSPVGMLLVGPLADLIFEPAMMSGGSLTPVFGGLIGVGTGAGMALMLMGTGVFVALSGLIGYAFPSIRNIEEILPDHDAEAVDSAVKTEETPVPIVEPAPAV